MVCIEDCCVKVIKKFINYLYKTQNSSPNNTSTIAVDVALAMNGLQVRELEYVLMLKYHMQ